MGMAPCPMPGEPDPEARPRKLLPDMDQIDETVQIYQQLGRKLLATLDAVQAEGLTVTINPGGPIVVRIPPMERRLT